MLETGVTPIRVFSNANRFIEAYHRVLQPLCKGSGLPPLAVDILMFAANNPDYATARNICKYRGMKPGIVSVHVERLVSEGYLARQPVPGDRRQTLLACTEALHKAMTRMDENIDDIRKNGL